jgi:type VI secretion system protein ImpF
MARRQDSRNERYLPPLMQAFRTAHEERDASRSLDLKDDAGERVIPGRRSSPRNAASEAVLREQLALDLGSLLNTVNLASTEDLAAFERVRGSVLNFGLPDLTAITADSENAAAVAAGLRQALLAFEPRLAAGSIRIEPKSAPNDAAGLIRLHVSAEMYSSPANVAVEFLAEIDADTGKASVSRR